MNTPCSIEMYAEPLETALDDLDGAVRLGYPASTGHSSARQPIGRGRRAIFWRSARAHVRPWNGRCLFRDLKPETVAATVI